MGKRIVLKEKNRANGRSAPLERGLDEGQRLVG